MALNDIWPCQENESSNTTACSSPCKKCCRCKPDKDRAIITDEICGTFDTHLPVPVPLNIYHVDESIRPFGIVSTISLYYGQGDPTLITVLVTYYDLSEETIMIPRGNTITRTLRNVGSLTIQTPQASGKYCLNIHYK